MLEILRDPKLAERTTLRLGGTTMAEVRIPSRDDLEALPECLARLGGEPVVLGCGSNLLAHDGHLPLVLLTPCFDEEALLVGAPIEQEQKSGDASSHAVAQARIVRVGASVRLPRLLARLAVWGLSGLEGLAGIPGSVGGAVAMNAGSYGCEMGPAIYAVTIYSQACGIQTLHRGDFSFAYRQFKPHTLAEGAWFIVLSVDLLLHTDSSDAIKARMRQNHTKKRSTQPIWAQSAGCIFRNPAAGVSAGKLLDEAGMRGVRMGKMAMSEVHANFLVNNGGGSSKDAFALLELAKERVYATHGIMLQCEVRILSCL